MPGFSIAYPEGVIRKFWFFHFSVPKNSRRSGKNSCTQERVHLAERNPVGWSRAASRGGKKSCDHKKIAPRGSFSRSGLNFCGAGTARVRAGGWFFFGAGKKKKQGEKKNPAKKKKKIKKMEKWPNARVFDSLSGRCDTILRIFHFGETMYYMGKSEEMMDKLNGGFYPSTRSTWSHPP